MEKAKTLKEKEQKTLDNRKKHSKEKWQKPTLEDVSGKIMAQPYIRFT